MTTPRLLATVALIFLGTGISLCWFMDATRPLSQPAYAADRPPVALERSTPQPMRIGADFDARVPNVAAAEFGLRAPKPAVPHRLSARVSASTPPSPVSQPSVVRVPDPVQPATALRPEAGS